MIWISTIRYGSLPGMAKVLVHMGTCSCIPIIHKIDYCFEYIVTIIQKIDYCFEYIVTVFLSLYPICHA